MDIKLVSYVRESDKSKIIDFYSDNNGECKMIISDEEELQNAQMAAFLPLNSIPQLAGNDNGVDWLGFLTDSNNVSFGEIDAQIRRNLDYINLGDKYEPVYSVENGLLKTEVRKI